MHWIVHSNFLTVLLINGFYNNFTSCEVLHYEMSYRSVRFKLWLHVDITSLYLSVMRKSQRVL